MRNTVFGITFQRGLQGIGCVPGMSVTELNLTFENQRLGIRRICLYNLVIQFARFVQTVLEN